MFIIYLKKQVDDQSGKLLLADKRLAELEASMDTKRKIHNKEMIKQLKTTIKEEVATMKSKVRETHSACCVCCSLVGSWSSIKYLYDFNKR